MDRFEPALGVFFGPQISQFWGVRILRDGRILGFQVFHPHFVDSTGRSPPRWFQSSGKIFQTWDSTWWHLRNSSNFSEKFGISNLFSDVEQEPQGDSSSLNCWWGFFNIFWYPNSSKVFSLAALSTTTTTSSEPQKTNVYFPLNCGCLYHRDPYIKMVYERIPNITVKLFIPEQYPNNNQAALFVQNAKLRIFESPKSRMASVHQVEYHAPSRRAPSTLGTLPTKPPTKPTKTMCLSLWILSFRLVIRVTPLVTHNISATIMRVPLQHVFYSAKSAFGKFWKLYIRNYVLHKGSSWEKLLGGLVFLCMKTIYPQRFVCQKCHMIPAFQNVATGNDVWMLAIFFNFLSCFTG